MKRMTKVRMNRQVNNAVLKAQQRAEAYKQKRPGSATGKIHHQKKVKPYLSVQTSSEVSKELVVKIIRAKDLVAADKHIGKSDPICLVMLRDEQAQTTVKHKTIDPNWDEQFKFALPLDVDAYLADTNLQVVVRDQDIVDSETIYTDLGQLVLPLASLFTKANRVGPQWFPLQPMLNMKAVSGQILISLRLLGCKDIRPVPLSPAKSPVRSPSPKRSPVRSLYSAAQPKRIVRVHVESIRYLFHLSKQAIVYCEITCGKEKHRSSGCSCPFTRNGWHHVMELGHEQDIREQKYLLIRIRMQNPSQQCLDDVGELQLCLAELLSKAAVSCAGNGFVLGEKWYPVVSEASIAAEILLNFSLTPSSISALATSSLEVPTNHLDTKQFHAIQSADQSRLLSRPSELLQDPLCPTLKLQIMKGRDLKLHLQESSNFAQELVCCVMYDSIAYQLAPVAAGACPEWHASESLDFPLTRPVDKITIQLKLRQQVLSVIAYEDLGVIQIPVSLHESTKEQSGWYEVQPATMSSATSSFCHGELYIGIAMVNIDSLLVQQPQLAPILSPRRKTSSTSAAPVTKAKTKSQLKQQSAMQDQQFLSLINDLVQKLEDRDTQQAATNQLKQLLTGVIKPHLVSAVVNAFLKTKNPERAATRKEILHLLALLCNHHPQLMAAGRNLEKLLGYILQVRIYDREPMVHEACATVIGTITLSVVPHLEQRDLDQVQDLRIVLEPVLMKFHDNTLQNTTKQAVAACICAIVRPPSLQPEIVIKTKTTKLTRDTVERIFNASGISNSQFSIERNTIVVSVPSCQVRQFSQRLQDSQHLPSGWMLQTNTSPESSDQLQHQAKFSAHSDRLVQHFPVIFESMLTELSKKDVTTASGGLQVALELATVTLEARNRGNLGFRDTWIPHVTSVCKCCHRIVTERSKSNWKARLQALELTVILFDLFGLPELWSSQNLLADMIDRGKACSNQRIRAISNELEAALLKLFGDTPRDGLDMDLNATSEFNVATCDKVLFDEEDVISVSSSSNLLTPCSSTASLLQFPAEEDAQSAIRRKSEAQISEAQATDNRTPRLHSETRALEDEAMSDAPELVREMTQENLLEDFNPEGDECLPPEEVAPEQPVVEEKQPEPREISQENDNLFDQVLENDGDESAPPEESISKNVLAPELTPKAPPESHDPPAEIVKSPSIPPNLPAVKEAAIPALTDTSIASEALSVAEVKPTPTSALSILIEKKLEKKDSLKKKISVKMLNRMRSFSSKSTLSAAASSTEEEKNATRSPTKAHSTDHLRPALASKMKTTKSEGAMSKRTSLRDLIRSNRVGKAGTDSKKRASSSGKEIFSKHAEQPRVTPNELQRLEHTIEQLQDKMALLEQNQHESTRTEPMSRSSSFASSRSTLPTVPDDEQVEAPTPEYSRVVRTAIEEGNLDYAYRVALKSEDQGLLLRLMEVTQPCLVHLSRATQNVLFGSILSIFAQDDSDHILQLFPWIFDALKHQLFYSLDPRVIVALEKHLYHLSSCPNDNGIYAAQLHYQLHLQRNNSNQMH